VSDPEEMKWKRMHLLNRRNYGILPEGAIPISRGTPFGNPFVIGRDGNRTEVIAKYREYFHEKIKRSPRFKKDVMQLLGHDLVCWCAPLPCHGQVIIDWLRSREVSVAKLKEQRAKRKELNNER
jgi:hypothetical protein